MLPSSEEGILVIALEESSRRGWLCGPEEIKLMVQSYLNRFGKKSVFKGNLHKTGCSTDQTGKKYFFKNYQKKTSWWLLTMVKQYALF